MFNYEDNEKMITYNEIYEAAKKERYSEQLQKLSKTFVEDFAEYIKEKKEIVSKSEVEGEVFSDSVIKTKKQIESAITFFKELIRRRKKKILDLVMIASETGISKQDFENMLPFEKELFENLMKCVESSDSILNGILNGKKQEEQKNELVIFKQDVEEFLDMNGEKMGPFKEGDIANIPKEVAKILIEDGKAEIISE